MSTGEMETDEDLGHADSVALLRRQTEVLELIASGASLPETLTGVAVALEELIEGSRCSILLLDADRATLRHGAAPSLPAAYSAGVDGLAVGPDSGACGTAAFLGEPVVAEDIGSDPRWRGFRQLARSHGLRSCWSSPILGRGGTVGTFAVYHGHAHRPPPRERRLVERFTHLATVAIDHAASEAASRAKSDFVSALSHEMRTPLQAITGFAELLTTLDLPAERRRAALEHIGAATAHVLSMVDDSLDIARIEAGALPVHLEDVALGEVCGEVLDLLAPLAAERGVVLHREPIDLVVRADRRRLRQVLLNLVGNGVHHNRRGGRVELAASPTGETVTVRVSDSGPGIPAEQLGRLFVPFDRLDADGPGAGLGMVLARALTEAMDGRLHVGSAPGVGTTVEVVLPGRAVSSGRSGHRPR